MNNKNFPFACLVELKKSDRLKLPHLRLVNSLNLLSFFSLLLSSSRSGCMPFKYKIKWMNIMTCCRQQTAQILCIVMFLFSVLHSSTYAVLPVCDHLMYSYIRLICGWVINNIKPRLLLYLSLLCTCVFDSKQIFLLAIIMIVRYTAHLNYW